MNNSDFKVFVTGADGMLGASICRELLSQGYKVKAMVILNRKVSVISDLDIEIIEGNVLDINGLESNMSDCQFVINVAALTNVWPRSSESVMKVNFQGAMNVAQVAQKFKLLRMVQIGTASSFGAGPKENPGVESTEYDSGKYQMDYITSKYLAQNALLEKNEKEGFPVIIVNPTFMIGPFDTGPSSGKMILEFYKGKVPAYTSGGKNFVSSLDVAAATVNALRHGNIGQCYIAGNENLTFGEFFQKVEKVSQKKFKMFRVPNALLFLFGLFNSAIARIRNKPPQISYTMARMAANGQYYNPRKAVDELKMPQTPIENAIEKCLNWYKKNGYLTD